MAAKTAAAAGVEVLLVEEDFQVGRPVKCTGLISIRALEEAGAGPEVVLRKIRGAFIYGPDGREIALDGRKTRAYVIDRAEFDRELVREAEAAGVRVRTGVRAVALEGDGLKIRHNPEGPEQKVKAKVIIGADGPYSRVRAWAGLPPPQKMLYGLQVIAPCSPRREDFVEVFLGRDVAPDFFAWAVPASAGVARIGLATDDGQRARSSLARLLQRKGVKEETILEFQGGAIPIGPAPRTVRSNVLVVGDAAGQAKPTSGGGIYTGIICAKLAGEAAVKAVKRGDISLLGEYEVRWRKELEAELRLGMLAHRILSELADADLDRILAALDDPGILGMIAEYGDIDYPSRLARHLLGEPHLWRRFAPLLPPMLLGKLRRALSGHSYPERKLYHAIAEGLKSPVAAKRR